MGNNLRINLHFQQIHAIFKISEYLKQSWPNLIKLLGAYLGA